MPHDTNRSAYAYLVRNDGPGQPASGIRQMDQALQAVPPPQEGWGTISVGGGTYGTQTYAVTGMTDTASFEGRIPPKESKLKPEWYFKILKKKLTLLETRSLKKRLKTLEKAFNAATNNGQIGFGEKILREAVITSREALIAAKGVRFFINRDDANKYKNKLKTGHISDTQFKDYTRLVPKAVLKKKEKTQAAFDGFVIYHYWNDEQIDAKNMSQEEKRAMKDPILFGWIKEVDRLYFVADWIDEACELTFDELCKVVSKQTLETPTVIKV